jgi:hypothetical protein
MFAIMKAGYKDEDIKTHPVSALTILFIWVFLYSLKKENILFIDIYSKK